MRELMSYSSATTLIHTASGGGDEFQLPRRSAGNGCASTIAAAVTASAHIAPVVQGNVWTTKDLVTELRQEFLRHGVRNTFAGLSYSGFGRGN